MKAKSTFWPFTLSILIACGKQTDEARPIRQDVTETVFASGVLEADGSYSLNSQAEGYLIEVNFNEGDLVQEGHVLAVVDNKESRLNTESAMALYQIAKENVRPRSPALQQATNSIITAKRNLGQDSINFLRYQRLMETSSVSKSDYENARLKYENSQATYASSLEAYRLQAQQAEQSLINQQTQKNVNRVMLSNNEIRAVVSGKVYDKKKQKGDYVRKGDVLAVIGDDSLIYAKVSIDESNIHRIRVGQEAIIQLNTNKAKQYKAKVQEIYPAFDESTQSFYCKLFFTDSLDFRITGTQMEANIIVGHQTNALLIPRNFLRFDGTVEIKGKTEPVKVVTKFIGTEWVQVVSGLSDDDVVITERVAKRTDASELGTTLR
jgi:multidrug efflux pump subunit AcrA (membrane-fusion protein)